MHVLNKRVLRADLHRDVTGNIFVPRNEASSGIAVHGRQLFIENRCM